MANRQLKSWTAFFVPAYAFLAMLSASAPYALSAQEHTPHAHPKVADIADVVGEMTGKVPPGEESHAIDYQKPPLQPELPLFLFTLVLFGGFVLLMKSAAWEPLISGLNAREARVINAESEARSLRVEVEQLTAKAELRMAEVQNEVKAIVAKARAEAEATRIEIVAQAEAEAQRVKQEALASIANARSAALAELEQTVDQQVALATEHVAGRRL